MVDKIHWVELTEVEKLFEIIPQWEKLIQTQTASEVFNSTYWMISWLETFWQDNWQLKTLTAWCNNELVAIIPLYLQRPNTIFSFNTLYPLGQGEKEEKEIASEYTDLLIKSEFQDSLSPKIRQWIQSLNAAQLVWRAMVYNSPTKNILMNIKQQRSSNELTRYLVDSTNWSPQCLSKNMRSRYRRGLNQLQKSNAKIDWVATKDFEHYWQLMKGFHQQRWEGKNKKGAFYSDEFNSFHADFRKASPKNIAMSAIWVNNTPIAIHYYFSDTTTLYFYQSGWNESEYSHLSPGLILHLWTIENNNKLYYDFMMGKKQDSYKAKLSTKQQPMYNITITFSPIKLMIYRVLKKLKLISC